MGRGGSSVHSLEPILNRESMHQYAQFLHDEISKQGAETVFYLTWARQDIPKMQDGADPGEITRLCPSHVPDGRSRKDHCLRRLV